MGKPLSPDHVFDFPEDELEPYPAYNFFVLALLPGEQMAISAIKEVVEPVAKAEEEQVIALVADIEEGQMVVPMIDMEEDLAVLFGENDNFEDNSEGRDETVAELTQQVQALQIDVQQRETQNQQTTVTEMGSRESTLMWCILGLERRIAALEKRSP
nr:hypothetical protein [Tanacetum cinerariifolium]